LTKSTVYEGGPIPFLTPFTDPKLGRKRREEKALEALAKVINHHRSRSIEIGVELAPPVG